MTPTVDDGCPQLVNNQQRLSASSVTHHLPRSSSAFAKKSESNKGSSSLAPPPPHLDEYRRDRVAIIVVLVVCIVIFVIRYDEVATWLFRHEDGIETKDEGSFESIFLIKQGALPGSTAVGGVGGEDDARTGSRSESGSGSVPTPSELLRRLSSARRKFNALLRAEYGKYVELVFDRMMVLEAFPPVGNMSSARLQRRLQIKVIEAALLAGRARGMPSGGEKGDGGERVTFRWITAGHSAAAGHGNMFNQTYTASVQSAASPVFDAVGIDFIAMSRAAGGTNSGPEASMCMEAIYGTDIDVLWWDFGMTDGRDDWLHYLWGNRVALHPTLPIMLNFDEDRGRRSLIREAFVRDGLAVFTLKFLQDLRMFFPDCKGNPEVDKMPRGVAYYMCGGHHENEDVCKDHKWDTARYCPNGGKFQTSWHNGWKDHLFIGRLASVFLLEHLEDAVRVLASPNSSHARLHTETDENNEVVPSVSHEYLDYLRSLEDAERDFFIKSAISKDPNDMGASDSSGLAQSGDDVFRAFLRRRSFCRPADLPSQSRYLGLATAGKRSGIHVGLGRYVDFEEGYDFKVLPPPNPSDNSTPSLLTRFEGSGNRDSPCYEISTMNIDFKDAFLVRSSDSWVTDVIPNEAEFLAYEGSRNPDIQREGIFMICTRWCDKGKCQFGHVGLDEIVAENAGNLSVIIDDQYVVGTNKINDRCYIMMSEENSTKFGPGGKSGRVTGQYEIKYRVNKDEGNLLISAIVIL